METLMATPTLGPWVYRGSNHQASPPIRADVHGAHGEFVADCGSHEMSDANARLVALAPELREALKDLVEIIDRAGLLNLSNGVQLGATSWYAKASDCHDYAVRVLAKAEGQ
jgi:hypothetical protein